MRNYGISVLCWLVEVDDRKKISDFRPFLILTQ